MDLNRLERPQRPVDVVLDTDAYNEIDDQYAIAYLVKSDKKLNLKAIYAAPFYNEKSLSAGDGMKKSYDEIINILKLMDRSDLIAEVYKGSGRFLMDEKTPVISEVAKDLVKKSKKYSAETPLYVVAIGAITNVASAILLDPTIVDRIVVVWLGGNAHHWPDNYEFNIKQDVAAARVLFDSKIPLVQLPCMGVVSSFTTTGPEIKHWLQGKNKLCDYLVKRTCDEGKKHHKENTWSRVIWDVTAVAWLLGEDFVLDKVVKCPIPEYDHKYSFDDSRHLIKCVYHINRDKLMQDLFDKISS